MGTVDQSSAKDEDCSFLPWQPPLLPPLRLRPSPATATATATELATDAPTEDTVATLVATGPMEATMARGRLSLLLLLRLKPIPTMALTDTVDFPTEATDALTEATDVLTDSLLTVATDVPTEDMVATDVATMARERPRLPLRPRLMLTTATVTDAAMEATDVLTDSLHTVATDASTEDMVATDVATTARGRPRLLLRLRLRLMLTTATVTDAATEAMDVLMVFLLMVVMAALTGDMEATDVATTERGRLRLPLRLRLLTDTATAAATEAMEATAAHMEATVATGPMVATAALTVMATESRQQPKHPTPQKQPQIAQYELKKIQVLDLLDLCLF